MIESLDVDKINEEMKRPPTEDEILTAKVQALKHYQKMKIPLSKQELRMIENCEQALKDIAQGRTEEKLSVQFRHLDTLSIARDRQNRPTNKNSNILKTLDKAMKSLADFSVDPSESSESEQLSDD